jgi:hypothetical protein
MNLKSEGVNFLKTSEILQKIANFKQNEDYEGFKNLFETLEFEELLQLRGFARELKKFCDKKLTEHF